jgi:GxxExxY protein
VHKQYGPGLLEKVYRVALIAELRASGVAASAEVPVAIQHQGTRIPRAYVMDVLVEDKLIIELKTVAQIAPVHLAQLRTQLRLADIRVGLLINFNVAVLRYGIRRVFRQDA